MSGRSTTVAVLLAVPLLLAAGRSFAGPAPEASPPQAPAEGAAPGGGEADRGADIGSVPAIQRRLENAMAELGILAQQAESDGDATRAACVKSWQQKGQDAMEVATSELLVIRDASSTDLQRSFAIEKLDATAERLETIVSQARKCSGDRAPEEEDDVARTEVDLTQTIPLQDPTLGGGSSPVPPPTDPNLPTTAASPSM